MPPDQFPSESASGRGCDRFNTDPLSTVVWVRGAHDANTCVALSVTIDEAMSLGDADIVVDLSGVTFMDASTVGALVGARNGLGVLSRSLRVRDPSPRARRVLDLCRLGPLIDEHATPAQPHVASALGSWVDVPPRDRGLRSAPVTPVAREAPSEEPACVMARPRLEPERLIPNRRAPS